LPPPIRNLVIARYDRLGDVVLSSSCLAPVRTHFPGASIRLLVAGPWRGLFQGHPAVDGLVAAPQGGWILRAFALAREFRGMGTDALALLEPDRAVEFGGWLGGVKLRAGFVRARCAPQPLTHRVAYRKSEGAKHEARYNFDVLQRLGVPAPGSLEASLSLDPAAAARLAAKWRAARTMEQCAVFHLAAHRAKPRAPLAAFGALAGWLNRSHGLSPVLVGIERDPPLDEVARAFGVAPAGITDLRGATDAAETGWLLRSAGFFAARDSGPAHLAAAVGCPTLVFFMDPRPILGPVRWRPLGPRVEVIPASPESPRAEEVMAAASKLLANGRGPAPAG
jgi:ADP-heptose:LPS heptosyltransferase